MSLVTERNVCIDEDDATLNNTTIKTLSKVLMNNLIHSIELSEGAIIKGESDNIIRKGVSKSKCNKQLSVQDYFKLKES